MLCGCIVFVFQLSISECRLLLNKRVSGNCTKVKKTIPADRFAFIFFFLMHFCAGRISPESMESCALKLRPRHTLVTSDPVARIGCPIPCEECAPVTQEQCGVIRVACADRSRNGIDLQVSGGTCALPACLLPCISAQVSPREKGRFFQGPTHPQKHDHVPGWLWYLCVHLGVHV